MSNNLTVMLKICKLNWLISYQSSHLGVEPHVWVEPRPSVYCSFLPLSHWTAPECELIECVNAVKFSVISGLIHFDVGVCLFQYITLALLGAFVLIHRE